VEVPLEVLVDRCSGLDVHQKTVMACIRAPAPGGGRAQQVREFRALSPITDQVLPEPKKAPRATNKKSA
jgi:hypothetical protein